MIHLLTALAMAAGTPTIGDQSGAAVISLGGSDARSCYEAAEGRRANAATLMQCSAALEGPLSADDRVATLVNRGILKLISDDVAGSIADFDRALALDPRQPEAHLNKGIAVYQTGSSAAALPLIDRAIALRTRRPALAFYARGVAREDVGDVRGAYADLQRARELAPTWSEPKAQLARFQVRSR